MNDTHDKSVISRLVFCFITAGSLCGSKEPEIPADSAAAEKNEVTEKVQKESYENRQSNQQ